MNDLMINLLASVIAGTAVWLAQFGLRRRRLDRQRAFFGLTAGAHSLLVTAKHFVSPSEHSVHRRDVAALVELATLVRECGAQADLLVGADVREELGRVTEFSVGGPSANPRAAVHLRTVLRGVEFRSEENAGERGWHKLELVIDGEHYESNRANRYAVLARFKPAPAAKPVFFLGGLTAEGNLAAARYLAGQHKQLLRTYGADQRFCLVLRVREPEAYGTDFTEVVADVSEVAFKAPQTGED